MTKEQIEQIKDILDTSGHQIDALIVNVWIKGEARPKEGGCTFFVNAGFENAEEEK